MHLPAMRLPERKYLIGGAVLALLAAGAAEAATAKLHTMKVNAPDGSVVEVHYAGDVAPNVQFVPASQMDPAAYEQDDPFAQMDRVSAMMDAQMHAMMQRSAVMQQQAAQMQQRMVAASANGAEGAPGFTVVGDMPQGSHFSYVSSTTDANGCTRTVSYSSEGQSANGRQAQDGKPQLTKVSSDSCEAAGADAAVKAVPVKAEAPVRQDAPAPGQKV